MSSILPGGTNQFDERILLVKEPLGSGKSFQAIFVALFSGRGVHIVTGWEVAGEMFCHGRQALPANALVRRNAQNPSRRCKWRGTGTFGKGGR